jgi:Ca2+-binding EF-hand superfamily protein
MSFDTTAGLFDEVDTNHDGNIDQAEFSQWAGSGLNGDVTSSSSNIITDDFPTVTHAGTDFGTDASYNAYANVDTGANAVFDKMDLNRNNVIERSEFNQFISDGSTTVSKSSTGDYVSKYPVDSRGLFMDPDPEIIIRPAPSPAPTYTQNIAIRYLKPPPLPPMGVSYFF